MFAVRRFAVSPVRRNAFNGLRSASSTNTAGTSSSYSYAMAKRIFSIGLSGLRRICTVTGGITLGGVGLIIAPYVSVRAPLPEEERISIYHDALAIADSAPDGHALSAADVWNALSLGHVPPFSYRDLATPWICTMFQGLARLTYALYSDAAGEMTVVEFKISMHKLVDVVMDIYSQKKGTLEASGRARAAAVRELTERVAPGVFRVLDTNGDGAIETHEFVRGALVLVAAVQGAPPDAPVLAGLAFRIVDTDGDGKVKLNELKRWVELALEFGTAPVDALLEPRGPFGWFGTRKLSPEQLAKKWLKHADFDGDGALTPDEFAVLQPKLRVQQVIYRLAKKFADNRLPSAPTSTTGEAEVGKQVEVAAVAASSMSKSVS